MHLLDPLSLCISQLIEAWANSTHICINQRTPPLTSFTLCVCLLAHFRIYDLVWVVSSSSSSTSLLYLSLLGCWKVAFVFSSGYNFPEKAPDLRWVLGLCFIIWGGFWVLGTMEACCDLEVDVNGEESFMVNKVKENSQMLANPSAKFASFASSVLCVCSSSLFSWLNSMLPTI